MYDMFPLSSDTYHITMLLIGLIGMPVSLDVDTGAALTVVNQLTYERLMEQSLAHVSCCHLGNYRGATQDILSLYLAQLSWKPDMGIRGWFCPYILCLRVALTYWAGIGLPTLM